MKHTEGVMFRLALGDEGGMDVFLSGDVPERIARFYPTGKHETPAANADLFIEAIAGAEVLPPPPIGFAIIPALLLGGLTRYVEDGIPTGSFLHAVLEGNLFMAYRTGDPMSITALREIINWLAEYSPSPCWGSVELVAEWLEMDDDDRAERVANTPRWEERTS